MKTFVIGDIHGCYEEFEKLVEKININFKEDRLVLLGDYIDRGDNSFEVVEKIIALEKEYGKDNIILLKGNHELMAIDFFEGKGSCYLYNSGNTTIKEYKSHNRQLEEHIGFFKGLRNYYQDEHYIYVHGGIKPGVDLQEQEIFDLLWIREEFYLSTDKCSKGVIFGHTPTIFINSTYYPININGNMALDTECVYGGYLSALEFEEGKVVNVHQVKSNILSRKGLCA